jgi:hypothetical protein
MVAGNKRALREGHREELKKGSRKKETALPVFD